MPRKLELDEAQLVAAYEGGESAYGIAKRLGVSHGVVWSRLRKLGVNMRSSTEQIKLRAAKEINHVKIVPKLREILDGLLLSDASLLFNRPRTSALLRMEQRPDRRKWLEQLQAKGERCGVTFRIDSVFHSPSQIGDRELPGGNYLALRSLNYAEFAEERLRWYPQGKKQVPQDLVLTPEVLLNWFCGDGKGGDAKGTLGLCTDDFSESGVELLVHRLQIDLGITSLKIRQGTTSKGKPRWQILVGRLDEAHRVKELIGAETPECFLYKFRHVRRRSTTGRGRKLSEEDIAFVEGLPRTSITEAVRTAAEHGVRVSRTTVWRLWNKK